MALPAEAGIRRKSIPLSSATAAFSPAQVMEIELTAPLPSVSYEDWRQRVWMLGRLHGEPVGACVLRVGQQGIDPEQLGAMLWGEFGEAIRRCFLAAGLVAPSRLAGSGLSLDVASWPGVGLSSNVAAREPTISVIVCTRARTMQLAGCLRDIDVLDYPRFEVVVVDNAPANDENRKLVEAMNTQGRYRYVIEPRPGLSWARNAGVAAAHGEIVAFLDDDDRPDNLWLKGLARGFSRSARIGCVTGLILPARLETLAQEIFELLGGHHKGLGFERKIFSRSGPRNPLYPLPPFGTGANMAFSKEALRTIGGFNVALGAGTATAAGEDTLALTLTLLAGYEIAYEPAALMWHHHRKDLVELNRQLHGYSIGLAAFYAALLHRRPSVLPALLKLLPDVARYLRTSASPAPAPLELMVEADTAAEGALAKLDRRHIWGMLKGPTAYLRSVRTQRRSDSCYLNVLRTP
jgi:O-antigen biosynthesis protein